MTTEEIAASGAGLFSRSEEYERAGITLLENYPEEIRDVALEMLARNPDPQTAFWKSYPRSVSPHNGIPLHGKIRLRIGTKFLRRYEN